MITVQLMVIVKALVESFPSDESQSRLLQWISCVDAVGDKLPRRVRRQFLDRVGKLTKVDFIG